MAKAGRTAHSSWGFVIAVVLTLAAAGFNGLMVALMALRLEELLPGAFARMGHFTQAHHRMHDLMFALLFVPAVLGLLAQFRRPERNIAGMLMTLVPGAALVLVLAFAFATGGNARTFQPPWVIVTGGALLATSLHPAGAAFSGSFRRARLDSAMAALVVVAAVPSLAFAWSNISLQANVSDDHAAAGHYGFMAAFALATIGLAVLASLHPHGWRLAAWTTGLLPALFGAASLAYPHATSSLAPAWALAAIAWGATFVAMALRAQSAAQVSWGR